MKTDSHHSICIVKSFLNSISMMNINVKVKDSRINFQKLKNTQNYIIYIAKTTSFRFLCMMETAWPVYHYITLACNNKISCINASTCSKSAEIKKSLKARTIKTLVDFEDGAQFEVFSNFCSFLLLTAGVLFNDVVRLRRDPSFKIFDIERMMKHFHLLRRGFFSMIFFEKWWEWVVVEKTMNHFSSLGFHGMLLAELIVGDIFIVEVANFSHLYIIVNFHLISLINRSFYISLKIIYISFLALN